MAKGVGQGAGKRLHISTTEPTTYKVVNDLRSERTPLRSYYQSIPASDRPEPLSTRHQIPIHSGGNAGWKWYHANHATLAGHGNDRVPPRCHENVLATGVDHFRHTQASAHEQAA